MTTFKDLFNDPPHRAPQDDIACHEKVAKIWVLVPFEPNYLIMILRNGFNCGRLSRFFDGDVELFEKAVEHADAEGR